MVETAATSRDIHSGSRYLLLTAAAKPRIFMKDFWKKNRFLLIALSLLVCFVVAEGSLATVVFSPVSSGRFSVDPTHKIDSKFWIITKETYGVTLWVGKPKEFDWDTFDRLTGCPDLTKHPFVPVPGVTIPFQWAVKSLSDQGMVAKSNAPSITPPGNGCSSSAGGRLLSLGSLSIDPGRYQFEFRFSEEIPAFKNFQTEVYIGCCGKRADTWFAGTLIFINFVVLPILLLLVVLLALILLIRAGMDVYAARLERTDRLKNP